MRIDPPTSRIFFFGIKTINCVYSNSFQNDNNGGESMVSWGVDGRQVYRVDGNSKKIQLKTRIRERGRDKINLF